MAVLVLLNLVRWVAAMLTWKVSWPAHRFAEAQVLAEFLDGFGFIDIDAQDGKHLFDRAVGGFFGSVLGHETMPPYRRRFRYGGVQAFMPSFRLENSGSSFGLLPSCFASCSLIELMIGAAA